MLIFNANSLTVPELSTQSLRLWQTKWLAQGWFRGSSGFKPKPEWTFCSSPYCPVNSGVPPACGLRLCSQCEITIPIVINFLTSLKMYFGKLEHRIFLKDLYFPPQASSWSSQLEETHPPTQNPHKNIKICLIMNLN